MVNNNLISVVQTQTITDGDTDNTNDSASVGIAGSLVFVDGFDPPQALDNSFNFAVVAPPINLTLMLDISGSMGTAVPGGGGQTVLGALQQTVAGPGGLIDTLNGLTSDLDIWVIPTPSASFNTPIGSPESSFAAFYYNAASAAFNAKAYVNSLAAIGNEYYDGAMQYGLDTLTGPNPMFVLGEQNIVYFIADGIPVYDSIGTNIPTIEADWQNALNTYNADAVAIAIGGGGVAAELEPIANRDPDDSPLVLQTNGALTNFDDLVLTGNQTITGNILNDDILGSATSYTINSFSQTGAPIVNGTIGAAFTTDLGATLTVQLNGDFTYTAPLSLLQSDITETFDYSLITNLSDTSAAQFEIVIDGLGGGVAPVIIDLNDDGRIALSTVVEGVQYDINNDGYKEQTSWVGEEDGFLVFDVNNDQQVTGSNEFVFTQWDDTATTDMEALRNIFDTNQDGMLSNADQTWEHFGVWQDVNQDGTHQEGEFFTLADLDIESINLVSDGQVETINGNTVFGTSEVALTSGESLTAYDVSLTYQDVIAEAPIVDDNSPIDAEVPVQGSSDAVVTPDSADVSIQHDTAMNDMSMQLQNQNVDLLA
tara:strand:- start:131 stop:1918 length:1788 start_codon:yes stop_codon:yes gene_type:complete